MGSSYLWAHTNAGCGQKKKNKIVFLDRKNERTGSTFSNFCPCASLWRSHQLLWSGFSPNVPPVNALHLLLRGAEEFYLYPSRIVDLEVCGSRRWYHAPIVGQERRRSCFFGVGWLCGGRKEDRGIVPTTAFGGTAPNTNLVVARITSSFGRDSR